MPIDAGQHVVVTDAFGRELERVAIGGPERGADFPVIWVCRHEEWKSAREEGREPAGVPWPVEDVRAIQTA